MKKFLLLLTIALLSTKVGAQSYTLSNDEFKIKGERPIGFELDDVENIFKNILFYKRENIGLLLSNAEIKFINLGLLESIIGDDIFFNSTILYKNGIYGFYTDPNLKRQYILNLKGEKLSANIFTVLDIIYNDGQVVGISLKKKFDDGTPTLYFSPNDFVKKAELGAGSLENLGMFWVPNLNYIVNKYKKMKFYLGYHKGDVTNIPDNMDVPASYATKLKKDGKLDDFGQSVSEGLGFASFAASRSKNVSAANNSAALSIILSVASSNLYKKQIQAFQDFKEKQRNLLFDFNLSNEKYLNRESFSPYTLWTCIDIRILEDTHIPVLVMQNPNKETILLIEKQNNLLLDFEYAEKVKVKYGKEKFEALFNGEYDFGMPLELVRFAKGYENKIISWENSTKDLIMDILYDKVRLKFKNNELIEEDWAFDRDKTEKLVISEDKK